MIAKFIVEVKRYEKVYQVEVNCYDSNESLNSARQKYEQDTTGQVSFAPVKAITHSFYSLGSDGDDSSRGLQKVGTGNQKLISIIRFDETAGAAITAHEALHAACHIYKLCYGHLDLGDLEDGAIEKEELLAHIQSDLIFEITEKLISLGVWK